MKINLKDREKSVVMSTPTKEKTPKKKEGESTEKKKRGRKRKSKAADHIYKVLKQPKLERI